MYVVDRASHLTIRSHVDLYKSFDQVGHPLILLGMVLYILGINLVSVAPTVQEIWAMIKQRKVL